MRKNERKHTEKNLKKNRKNRENELAKSPRIVQIGSYWQETAVKVRSRTETFKKRPRCQKTTAISWKRTEPYENGRKCPKADVGV